MRTSCSRWCPRRSTRSRRAGAARAPHRPSAPDDAVPGPGPPCCWLGRDAGGRRPLGVCRSHRRPRGTRLPPASRSVLPLAAWGSGRACFQRQRRRPFTCSSSWCQEGRGCAAWTGRPPGAACAGFLQAVLRVSTQEGAARTAGGWPWLQENSPPRTPGPGERPMQLLKFLCSVLCVHFVLPPSPVGEVMVLPGAPPETAPSTRGRPEVLAGFPSPPGGSLLHARRPRPAALARGIRHEDAALSRPGPRDRTRGCCARIGAFRLQRARRPHVAVTAQQRFLGLLCARWGLSVQTDAVRAGPALTAELSQEARSLSFIFG